MGYRTESFAIFRMMKDILFHQSLPLGFLLLPLYCNNRTVLKWANGFFVLVSSVAYALVAFVFIYFKISGVKIAKDSLVAIMQSNKRESYEFLVSYLSPVQICLMIAGLLLFISVAAMLYRRLYTSALVTTPMILKNKFFKILCNPMTLAVFSIILLISSGLLGVKTYLSRTYKEAVAFQQSFQEFNSNRKARMAEINRKDTVDAHKGNESFALIIGETTARSHMHCYGYARETTPNIDKQLQNKTAFLIPYAFSCAAQTIPALQMSLTEQSQYNGVPLNKAATLVEMAQHAGYNVVWFSNQATDSIAGLLAMESDRQFWINRSTNDTYLRQRNNLFDGNIADVLEKMEKPLKKTLYIIHLLGSHADYSFRYPDEFEKWQDGQRIKNRAVNNVDSFDNSVLYNDYVVDKLGNILIQKFGVSAILYYSDHGEELKDHFCHGTDFFITHYQKSKAVHDIVKIPTLLLVSPEYRETHKDILKNWEKNSSSYFTNDMIYDTMLGLMNIKCQHYYSKQDFTSEDFGFELDELRTIHGKVKLKDCL